MTSTYRESSYEIPEYKILKLVDATPEMQMYRALHSPTGEERTVQIFHGRRIGKVENAVRFYRFVKRLPYLRHPQLEQYYQFGELTDDVYFLAQETPAGPTLLQYIHEQQGIEPPVAVRWLRQAALGLLAAHRKGLIHGSPLPENLLVISDNEGNESIRVAGFPRAWSRTESTNPFQKMDLLLSRAEANLSSQVEPDVGTDLYCLGVTLYRMLTGKIATAEPESELLDISRNRFPKSLVGLLSRLLDRKQESGPAGMEELIAELEDLSFFRSSSGGSTPVADAEIVLPPNYHFAGRYVIDRRIGRGGMGKVYKARDTVLDVAVALKVMPEAVLDSEKVERFKREVIVSRRITHPNACRIFDMGESEGVLYVSMEYLEGKTLGAILRAQNRLAVDDGLLILKQVLQALQAAHRQGIVHRDLKPENIMVDDNKQAHLMDFGLSISLDAGRMTQTGAIVGTPHYMAPEQFEGSHIDQRSDIYAVGVIMYRMFTGQVPFDSDSPAGIIFAHIKTDPVRPSELTPGLPTELEQVILKSMEKDPDDRYQTVRDLAQALRPLEKAARSLRISFDDKMQKLMQAGKLRRAIRYAKAALRHQPANKKFQKALAIANKSKLRRDLRKADHSIDQRNLVATEYYLSAIPPHISGTADGQIRELSIRLHEIRERIIENALVSAQQDLDLGKWEQAMTSLTEAWNMKPEDQRLLRFLDMIRPLQMEQNQRQKEAELEKIQTMVKDGNLEEALNQAEFLLRQDSEWTALMGVREVILRQKQMLAEEERIRQQLESICALVGGGEFHRALGGMQNLKKEVVIEEFREELDRIGTILSEIQSALGKQEYDRIPTLLSEWQSKDSRGWVQPYSHHLLRTVRYADEKRKGQEKARNALRQQLADRMGDVIRMLEENRSLRPALERLSATARDTIFAKQIAGIAEGFRLLQTDIETKQLDSLAKNVEVLLARYELLRTKESDLRQLADRIVEKRRMDWEERFQLAVEHYEGKRWEEALELFEKLKEENQDATGPDEYLPVCRDRAHSVQRLREKLKSAAAECDRLLFAGKWEETILCADQALQGDFSDFLLQDELKAVQGHLASAKHMRTKHVLGEGTELLSFYDLEGARRQFERVLNWDQHNASALDGIREIERRIKIKRDQSLWEKITPYFQISLPPVWILRLALVGILVGVLIAWFVYLPPEFWVMRAAKNSVEKGDLPEARSTLEKYLKRVPDSRAAKELYLQIRVRPEADKIQALLKQARQRTDAREYDEAAKLYNDILKIDPLDPEARGELEFVTRLQNDMQTYLNNAQASYNNQNFQEAWNQINQVLTIAPDYPPALKLLEDIRKKLISQKYNEARDLFRHRDYNAAITLLEEALALDVSNDRVRSLLEEATRKKYGR